MKILLAYVTKSGSTVEVAEAIQRELSKNGAEISLKAMQDVADIAGYDAVILGAPMILGWHRAAMKFLETHQAALSRVPVALFITCASLTDDGSTQVGGVPIELDPKLVKTPKKPGKLGFEEKQTTPAKYIEPILKKGVKPVSIAVFGGKVDYSKLDPLSWLFVRLVIRVKAGDNRNWDVIQSWAGKVGGLLAKNGRA